MISKLPHIDSANLADFFPVCFCGQPREVIDLFVKALDWFSRKEASAEARTDRSPAAWDAYYEAHRPLYEEFEKETCGGNAQLFWLVLYTLDSCGLIEHGGGVSSGWLTPHGERALALAKAQFPS